MFYTAIVMLVAITLRVTPTLSAPVLWEFNDLEAREDTKLFTRGNCQGCFSREPVGNHLSATGDEVDRQGPPNNRPSTDVPPADSLRSLHEIPPADSRSLHDIHPASADSHRSVHDIPPAEPPRSVHDISPADSPRSAHSPSNSVSSYHDSNLPSPRHVMAQISQLNQRIDNLRARVQQQQQRQSAPISSLPGSSSGPQHESVDDYHTRLAVESPAKAPTDAWDGKQPEAAAHLQRVRDSLGKTNPSSPSGPAAKHDPVDDYYNQLAVAGRAKATGQSTDTWDSTQAAAHRQRVRDSFSKMNPSSSSGPAGK